MGVGRHQPVDDRGQIAGGFVTVTETLHGLAVAGNRLAGQLAVEVIAAAEHQAVAEAQAGQRAERLAGDAARHHLDRVTAGRALTDGGDGAGGVAAIADGGARGIGDGDQAVGGVVVVAEVVGGTAQGAVLVDQVAAAVVAEACPAGPIGDAGQPPLAGVAVAGPGERQGRAALFLIGMK